jgi:outer membrane protein OmpA-like peptidoglycan-associated protein
MHLGDLVSEKYQLNATFSVEGKVQYSVNPGFTPELGNFDITLTFTPDDLRRYYVISTTRTINVTQLNIPQGDSSKTKLNPSQFQLKLIGNILFNKNEYFLDSQDRKKISDYASQIKAAKSNNVIILGNSDLKNGVDNIWLSKSRADAVSKYFGNFLPTSTLTRAWYGPTRPAVIGVDKESLAKNRRVEIYFQVPKSELEAIAVNPVFKEFAPISFNRNEYFLDARDRKALLNYAKSMTSLGCTLVSIVGTEDFKKGGLPNIGDLRSTAVKDYLETLNGQLNFQLLDSETSDKREVRISCKTK